MSALRFSANLPTSNEAPEAATIAAQGLFRYRGGAPGVAGHFHFGIFLPLLLPARRPVAVWRRGSAHQHCAARVRFENSGGVAVGTGVAAAAASPDPAIHHFQANVANRCG